MTNTNYKVVFNDYNFMDEEGTFSATLVHKMFGKKNNMVIYLDFDDGRKIVSVAYKESDYLGIKDIEIDSKVEVTYEQSQSGIFRLVEINVIE